MTCGCKILLRGLFAGLVFIPAAASAALILDYDVNIVQSGSVVVGSSIDWEVFATVSGTPDSGSNFGIATSSVSLSDSFSESLSAGTIGSSFSGYDFSSGGTFNAPQLQFIGAFDLTQSAATAGTAAGSFLLASGSYTLTQEGLHTLQALVTVDTSTYFTAAGQSNMSSVAYDQVNFGSDTIQAVAVPEPSSLAVLALGTCALLAAETTQECGKLSPVFMTSGY